MEPIHILLVEDNEGDILLTRHALEETNILTELTVVKDGKEAMDFLDGTLSYSDAAKPGIIILDINLPKRNGHQVLKFIKEHEDLKHIPVIMLTTSSSPTDIKQASENAVNWFITKPLEPQVFIEVMASINKPANRSK
ncbi:MAG: two-component system response regulator [Ferruginibacter sp.]|nr:two-component system response regulator [Ferruginibacter sp.]